SRETIILLLPQGIEFVVVAAGTLYGEAEERLSDRSDDVLQLILAHVGLHDRTLLTLPHRVKGAGHEESGGGERAAVVWRENITRELQASELVVRQIGVERLDDPVAIRPGVLA